MFVCDQMTRLLINIWPFAIVKNCQKTSKSCRSKFNFFCGSGCGLVGRAVAFNTRGPRVDSSHRQNFIEHFFIINCIEKTKINKKSLNFHLHNTM